MKKAGNEKSLESIYKNGKKCFPKRRWNNVFSTYTIVYSCWDKTLSHPQKTERQVSRPFDWKDTCLFCILLMQRYGMKVYGKWTSERGMMPNVAGDASIQIKAL